MVEFETLFSEFYVFIKNAKKLDRPNKSKITKCTSMLQLENWEGGARYFSLFQLLRCFRTNKFEKNFGERNKEIYCLMELFQEYKFKILYFHTDNNWC